MVTQIFGSATVDRRIRLIPNRPLVAAHGPKRIKGKPTGIGGLREQSAEGMMDVGGHLLKANVFRFRKRNVDNIPASPGKAPASIAIRDESCGFRVTATGSDVINGGAPPSFRVGFIILHLNPISIRLRAVKSKVWHITRWFRSIERPLSDNALGGARPGSTTCRFLGVLGECKANCVQFDSTHMTPKVWRNRLVEYGMAEFDHGGNKQVSWNNLTTICSDTQTDWVKYIDLSNVETR